MPNYEIDQLEKLSTWVIVDLPNGAPVIPCTEVLKEKWGPDGEIESYCIRIVAGGHRQVGGINYIETFSAAEKMPSVWVVLANAMEHNWEIHHVDIKSAYLNALLQETVYMKESWNLGRRGRCAIGKRPYMVLSKQAGSGTKNSQR